VRWQEDVLRFDVAVHHPAAVAQPQALQELPGHEGGLGLRQRHPRCDTKSCRSPPAHSSITMWMFCPQKECMWNTAHAQNPLRTRALYAPNPKP